MDDCVEYKLSLGTNIAAQDGQPERTVSDHELAKFLAKYVDTEYDGYTISKVTGSWKGMVEDTLELTICVPVEDSPDGTMPSGIFMIALRYRELFSQDAVMVTRTPVRVSFI